MSVKTIFRQSSITKKRFKNLGKIVGIGLFTLLMLTNIKFAMLDDAEIASGDISVLGIKMQLFEGTYGENVYTHRIFYNPYYGMCGCIQPGDECTGPVNPFPC